MKHTRKCSVCDKIKRASLFSKGTVCKSCDARAGRIVSRHIDDDSVLLKARNDIIAGVSIREAGRKTARLGKVGASEVVYKLGVLLAKHKNR